MAEEQSVADVEMESQTESIAEDTEPMDQSGDVHCNHDDDDKMSRDSLDKEGEKMTTNDKNPMTSSLSEDMSQSVSDDTTSTTETKQTDDDGTPDNKPQDETATVAVDETGEPNVSDGDNVQHQSEASENQGEETSQVDKEIKQPGKSEEVTNSKGVVGTEDPQTGEQGHPGAQTGEQDEVKSKDTPPTVAVADSSDEEEEEEIPEFPTTLEGFGYAFNNDGQLRSIDGDEGFQFVVKQDSKKYNQAHYEALGEVITDVVYELLEKEGNLKRVTVPENCKDDEPHSFFFMSEDALTNTDKLIILIHGSGVVRAGQWARSLIINDCLDSGTQLPYIKRAMKEGYGVMVLNTNLNYVLVDGKKTAIRENSTPQQHANYVWKHFVRKAEANKIDIVAHSFGGVVTVDLVSEYYADFKKRVHRIAFTDSVHMLSVATRNVQNWIISRTCNWVSSDTPLDTELESFFEDVKRVSAGTPKHVETSWFSFDSVFKFLSNVSTK